MSVENRLDDSFSYVTIRFGNDLLQPLNSDATRDGHNDNHGDMDD